MIIQILLLSGLVIFSILAILLKDLLKAALSLAVASLFLGIIFSVWALLMPGSLRSQSWLV